MTSPLPRLSSLTLRGGEGKMGTTCKQALTLRSHETRGNATCRGHILTAPAGVQHTTRAACNHG
jgi:hypothetical protein